jgi:hypothetical protein
LLYCPAGENKEKKRGKKRKEKTIGTITNKTTTKTPTKATTVPTTGDFCIQPSAELFFFDFFEFFSKKLETMKVLLLAVLFAVVLGSWDNFLL